MEKHYPLGVDARRGSTGTVMLLTMAAVAGLVVVRIHNSTTQQQAESGLARAKQYLSESIEESARIAEFMVDHGIVQAADCTATTTYGTNFAMSDTDKTNFKTGNFAAKSGSTPARLVMKICHFGTDGRKNFLTDNGPGRKCPENNGADGRERIVLLPIRIDLIREHCRDGWVDVKIRAEAGDRALFNTPTKSLPGDKLVVEVGARINAVPVSDTPPVSPNETTPNDPVINFTPGKAGFCFGESDVEQCSPAPAKVLIVLDASPSMQADIRAIHRAIKDVEDRVRNDAKDLKPSGLGYAKLHFGVTTMIPDDPKTQGAVYRGMAYKGTNAIDPGFGKLVTKASIAKLTSTLKGYKKRAGRAASLFLNGGYFPLAGCTQEWTTMFDLSTSFTDGSPDTSGENTCLDAAMQVTLRGGSMEAGVVSVANTLSHYKGKQLFPPNSIANVLFMSDTSDPGNPSAVNALRGEIDPGYAKTPIDLAKLVTDLNPGIKEVKFHAVGPTGIGGRGSCAATYTAADGRRYPLGSEGSQRSYTEKYVRYADADSTISVEKDLDPGFKIDTCTSSTAAQWKANFDKLLGVASTPSNPNYEYPLPTKATSITEVRWFVGGGPATVLNPSMYTLSADGKLLKIDFTAIGALKNKVNRFEIDYAYTST